MKAYPTSIKGDELALKGPSLVPYSNDRHARIQVLGEKRVLEHYSEFANSAIECLNGEVRFNFKPGVFSERETR